MIKRKIIPVVLFAFLLAGFSFSQELTDVPTAPPPPTPPIKIQKLEHLTKALDLNGRQVEELKEILSSSEGKLDKIREKYGDINREMMDQIKQVLDEEDRQIENKLDDRQKDIFNKMKNERMRHKPPMDVPRGK